MPRLVPFRLAAACALALILVVPGVAQAKTRGGVAATLRVVAAQKVLADTTMRTGSAVVPTSRAATCFGKKDAGSGRSASVPGPTPLGLLAQAARTHRSLRPLRVTDAFSFGLGLCAIGGIEARGDEFWEIRVNHRSLSVGGDAVKLKRGDVALFFLKPSFEDEVEELWLAAPRNVASGRPFRVRAFAYDEKGRRRPAAGVKVSGADAATDAKGLTTVTLRRPARLIARHGKYIPSNRTAVCVAGKCPRG